MLTWLSGHSHEFTNQHWKCRGKPTCHRGIFIQPAYSDVYLELDPVTKDVTSKMTIIIAYEDPNQDT